jgi:hypothetical protein
MRLLLTMFGSRGGVPSLVRLAAPEECDTQIATGVMPTGGWR